MSISLQLNTVLVTFSEKEQIKLQTDDSFLAEEKRIYGCCKTLKKKEKTQVIVQISAHVFENAVKGATASIIVGAPTFGFFGLIFGGIPGLIGGMKLGATLGAVGGAADGAYMGIKKFKIEFISSDKYKEWVEQARKTDVYPVYKKIIEEDERFEEYLCPLTCDLISLPVYAPDKRVYENQSITLWIKQKEEQIKLAIESGAPEERIKTLREGLSPVRAKVESFTTEDLRYHPEYFTKLDQLAKIKISEMENNEAKGLFQDAIRTIQSSQIENRKEIIMLQIAKVTMHVTTNDLDPSISTKICKELMQELVKIEKEEKDLALTM